MISFVGLLCLSQLHPLAGFQFSCQAFQATAAMHNRLLMLEPL
jgi:hypothetical protein